MISRALASFQTGALSGAALQDDAFAIYSTHKKFSYSHSNIYLIDAKINGRLCVE